MPEPLLITPRPEADEGLLGFLLRVTQANGYPDPGWIDRAAGVKRWSVFSGPVMDPFAGVLRLPTAEIDSRLYRALRPDPKRGQVSYYGKPVSRPMVDVKRPKICPHCLAERPILPALWDLSFMTVCPTHASALTNLCPACHSPLAWHRSEIERCACGFDLTKIETTASPDATVQLVRSIAARTDLWRSEHCQTLPAEFEALPLGQALDLVTLFGVYGVGHGQGKGWRLASQLDPAQMQEVLHSAARILSGWPETFYTLLDDVRRYAGVGKTRSGLEHEFRALYKALYPRVLVGNPPYRFVQKAFETYLQKNWDGGFVTRKNTKLCRIDHDEFRYISRAGAARQLGISHHLLDDLIDAGHIPVVQRQMGRRTLTLIDRQHLDTMRSVGADLINLRAAGTILGLSKGPLLDLVNRSIIPAHRGPRVDGSATWWFRRSSLNQFVDAVFSHQLDSGASDSLDPFISFTRALRRVSTKGLKVGDLLTAILSGTLPLADRDVEFTGLQGCRFRESAVLALLSAHRIGSTDWMSITMAARRLALKEEVAYQLAHRNLLRTRSVVVDRKPQLAVPADAIDEFTTSYVSASDLAAEYGTSPSHVVNELRRNGIRATTGPSIDQTRKYFFSRSRVRSGAGHEVLARLSKNSEGASYVPTA